MIKIKTIKTVNNQDISEYISIILMIISIGSNKHLKLKDCVSVFLLSFIFDQLLKH